MSEAVPAEEAQCQLSLRPEHNLREAPRSFKTTTCSKLLPGGLIVSPPTIFQGGPTSAR